MKFNKWTLALAATLLVAFTGCKTTLEPGGATRAGTWDIGAYDDGSTNAPVASGTVTTIGTLNVVNLHIGP